MAAITQALGKASKFARRLLGQRLPGLTGLELFWIGEGALQFFADLPVEHIFKREFVDFLNRVGPVGVDTNAVHIRHDQQRRIFQCDRVLQKLAKCLVEVFSRSFVFPCKAALAPNVSPTFAAAGLACSLFKGKPIAGRVGGDGIDHAEQRTQVIEVALRGGPFLEFGSAPFGNEVLWGHALRLTKSLRQCRTVARPAGRFSLRPTCRLLSREVGD